MVMQAHVYIRGDVIGVGFRAWTKIQAKIYSVKGWVRNNFEKSDFYTCPHKLDREVRLDYGRQKDTTGAYPGV
jgi:hypothetical protein